MKRVYVFTGRDTQGRPTVGCSYEQAFPSEKPYVSLEDVVESLKLLLSEGNKIEVKITGNGVDGATLGLKERLEKFMKELENG